MEKHRGFTLMEVLTVIVILGALSITFLPRFADSLSYHARGFHDETLALLRYAQKSAISHRRTVCVTFTSSSATLTIASTAGTSNCNSNLIGPRGESPATATAKTGVSYASTPATFNFNGLGEPSFSTSQTIQISGMTDVITIEAETGYVH